MSQHIKLESEELFNLTDKAVKRNIYLTLNFLNKNIVNLPVVVLLAKSFGISQEKLLIL